MDINVLWAKTDPWQSLPEHMKEVGDVAVRLLTDSAYDGLLEDLCKWSALNEDDVIKLVRYLAAMHDIGKAHPSFQAKNGEPLPYGYEDEIVKGFRHERAVLDIAPYIWKNWDRKTRRFLAGVLSLHHQHRNRTCVKPLNDKWHDVWIAVESEIKKWADFTDVSVKTFPNADAFCTILTGLVIISDWIASSGDIDKAFLGLDLSHQEKLKPFNFEKFGYEPRKVQAEVMDAVNKMVEMPLTMVIEAPPGEGKTELAIWLAHKMGNYWGKKGIYFALPTAATSNQMVGRVRDFLQDDVLLMHSMAWLENEPTENLTIEERDARNRWRNPQKRAMLSRYAVGTVDQVMLSVLKVRYGVLRLLGLTDKVVIIDEIHAYDAYMTEIIKRLVEWLNELQIPVVMLSATLPSERKKTLLGVTDPLMAYPLVTSIFADGHSKQFAPTGVFRHMTAEIEVVKGFDGILPDGMNCIIVNTVEKAQKIYDQIKGPKLLFHGRYTAALKKEIENIVLSLYGKGGNRGNFTLVATQVVEQSLDIDFDYLITELAPIDLIFQRIGRLHRHSDRGTPKCKIFYEPDIGKTYGKSEFVYHKLLLEKTKNLLDGVDTLTIPTDIRPMIEKVYSEDVDPEELELFVSFNQENVVMQTEADSRILNKPSKKSFGLFEDFELAEDDEMTARTRLGTGYKLCILPENLYDEAIRLMDNIPGWLAKEISEYIIPVVKDYEGIEGKGRLAGYKLRKGTASSPKETSISKGEKETLIMDKENGLCSM